MSNEEIQKEIENLRTQVSELMEWKRNKELVPFNEVEIAGIQKDIPVVVGDFTSTSTTISGGVPVVINGINRTIAII